MLIMVAGAARAHKLMVEEHAHAKHGTGQSGHGGDLGFGLIPEWTFLEKNYSKNKFSWDPAGPRTSTSMKNYNYFFIYPIQ